MSKYVFKNLRTAEGDESPMFSASLYRDGRRIGTVRDTGQGGAPSWNTMKGADTIAFKRHAKETASKEALESEYATQWAVEELIGRLYDEALELRWLKRLCKTKTLFKLATDGDDEGWRTFNNKFSDKIKAHIVSKYGADCRIANEEIRS